MNCSTLGRALSPVAGAVIAAAMLVDIASAEPIATADSAEVLLASAAVTVTTEDFNRYLNYRFPDRAPDDALAVDGAVRATIESIYTIRLIAEAAREEATQEDLLQAAWEAQYLLDRALMKVFVAEGVQQRIKEIDFSALAREQYELNPEQYVVPETRRASHILFRTDNHSEEEALQLAEAALAELENGRSFAELATELSEDPSAAENAGDLGFFGRGAMVKPFEDAAFAMQVGETSEPVLSRFGYHIIRLEEVEPERTLTFEEVEPRLILDLRAKRQPTLRQEFIEEMKAKSVADGILSNQELIQEIEATYAKKVPGS